MWIHPRWVCDNFGKLFKCSKYFDRLDKSSSSIVFIKSYTIFFVEFWQIFIKITRLFISYLTTTLREVNKPVIIMMWENIIYYLCKQYRMLYFNKREFLVKVYSINYMRPGLHCYIEKLGIFLMGSFAVLLII